MRRLLLTVILILFGKLIFAQTIKKSWILVKTENLSSQPSSSDSLKYSRYEFDNNNVYISFYPAWYGSTFTWSLSGNNITVGYETYKLEVLTDTSLVFAKEAFRRFRLVSESKYSTLKPKRDTALSFNGSPVYVADNYFTPRLKKQYDIREIIKMADYNIKREMIFLAKFIVTDKGKVERIEIERGITSGFDEEFKNHLLKTSGKWIPATLNNKPVNSELKYTIHYLRSLTDF